MAFIKNYKYGMVQLKSLKIMVNEESIAEAIAVPANENHEDCEEIATIDYSFKNLYMHSRVMLR